MSAVTSTVTNRRLSRCRSQVVRESRDARRALTRVVRLAEPASRESQWIDDEGLQRFDLVRLGDSEQLENLRVALAWLQQAETKCREVRVLIERALDNDGWRLR